MSISQVKFLDASITGFSCSIGWGTQESRLTVNLVNDSKNGDAFNPPQVGTPVFFNYQGWKFNGLLERWAADGSINGNPIFTVSVVDPRVILSGVQLILSEYYGTSLAVNVMNVFGYLEHIYGFGGSQKNDSGIPYQLVYSAISSLSLGGTLYGTPITLNGYEYILDLSELPLITSYYRVSGSPSISIMDFITEICDAGACEFFFILTNTNTIKLRTISRKNIPLSGIIQRFVESTDGAVTKSIGLDMVNENVGKFLIGGPLTDIIFTEYGTGNDGNLFNSSSDNPIWYYWGVDNDNNLILSDGENQDFYLDARSVLIQGVADVYKTDINEMRMALASQDAWEQFLWMNCFNKYEFDANGDETEFIYKIDENGNFVKDNNTKYKHSGYENPHFRKAYDIGISPTLDYNIVSFLLNKSADEIINANINEIIFASKKTQNGLDKEIETDMSKLYNLIYSYADEYYGRKFMVMVPNIYVKQEPETDILSYSHNTTEGGYLSEDVIANAVNTNLLPFDTEAVRLLDGRISAYVRFDNIENLDLTLIAPEDLLFGVDLIKDSTSSGYEKGIHSLFVRCTVDDDFVFVGPNYTSPRAIVTLTSRIFIAGDDKFSERVLVDFLTKVSGVSDTNNLSNNDIKNIQNKFITSTIGDLFALSGYPVCAIPNMAAIPIKSNIDTYGPWFSASADGKIEVEYAEDLVPWNYGGYTNMNLAANARVILAAANLQWMESGSVEFPGIPLLQLGDQLLTSGPYVTDIRVNIGNTGLITSYSMRSWQPQYGKSAKTNLDMLAKAYKFMNQMRKNFNQKVKLNSYKDIYLQVKNQLPNIQ